MGFLRTLVQRSYPGMYGCDTSIADARAASIQQVRWQNPGRKFYRTVAFAAVALAGGCGSMPQMDTDTDASETGEVGFAIVGIEWTQATHVLGGTLRIHASQPARLVSVVITGSDTEASVPASGLLTAGPATELAAMILGLKASRAYTFEIALEDGQGNPHTAIYEHQTPALPEEFAPLQFRGSDPSRMEPGVTFFDSTAREGFASRGGYLIAVDEIGEVVWYYTGPAVQQPCDLRRLQNGNLLFLGIGPNGLDTWAVEIDMLGEVQHVWPSPALGIGAAHADLAEIPSEAGDGPILTAGLELRDIAGYPNDKTYSVVGDTIIEFSRSGEVVFKLSLLDVLDPYRIVSPDFHAAFWAGLYGIGTKDWAHVNAVSYDPEHDAYLVSARHQDIVFQVSRGGELVWVIGEDDPATPGDDAWPFLTLEGGGSLPNHMHAAKMLPDGHVLMFDNANASGLSRAVEYALDLEQMTLTQVWEYRDPDFEPAIFSPIIGDADRLPGGNYLIDFGAVDRDPETVDLSAAWTHIVEVDPQTGDKVFELDVKGAPEDSTQRLVYRVDRQPSLYPL